MLYYQMKDWRGGYQIDNTDFTAESCSEPCSLSSFDRNPPDAWQGICSRATGRRTKSTGGWRRGWMSAGMNEWTERWVCTCLAITVGCWGEARGENHTGRSSTYCLKVQGPPEGWHSPTRQGLLEISPPPPLTALAQR